VLHGCPRWLAAEGGGVRCGTGCARRAAQLGAAQGAVGDDAGGQDLFSLQGAERVVGGADDAPAPDEDDIEGLLHSDDDSGDNGGHVPAASNGGGEGDEDDDALRYEMEMEGALEDSYRGYLERKGQREDVRQVGWGGVL
jgi:AdoMet-dependent rRNA methyltransferase SPB1